MNHIQHDRNSQFKFCKIRTDQDALAVYSKLKPFDKALFFELCTITAFGRYMHKNFPILPGQVVINYSQLARKFGCSRSKIWDSLKRLFSLNILSVCIEKFENVSMASSKTGQFKNRIFENNYIVLQEKDFEKKTENRAYNIIYLPNLNLEFFKFYFKHVYERLFYTPYYLTYAVNITASKKILEKMNQKFEGSFKPCHVLTLVQCYFSVPNVTQWKRVGFYPSMNNLLLNIDDYLELMTTPIYFEIIEKHHDMTIQQLASQYGIELPVD